MGTVYRAVCRPLRQRFEPHANKLTGWLAAGPQLVDLMTLGQWAGEEVEVWSDDHDAYSEHRGELDAIDAWPNLWKDDWSPEHQRKDAPTGSE